MSKVKLHTLIGLVVLMVVVVMALIYVKTLREVGRLEGVVNECNLNLARAKNELDILELEKGIENQKISLPTEAIEILKKVREGNQDQTSWAMDMAIEGINWIRMSISVTDYRPGLETKVRYEGMEQTIDWDKIVKNLEELKTGRQSTTLLGDLWREQVLAERREINGNYYATYDTFFKPGGNNTRHYLRYDEKSKKVIDVRLATTTTGEMEFDEKNAYLIKVVYPEIISRVLLTIENAL